MYWYYGKCLWLYVNKIFDPDKMAAVMQMAFLVTVRFVNTRLDNGLSLKRRQAIFQICVDL